MEPGPDGQVLAIKVENLEAIVFPIRNDDASIKRYPNPVHSHEFAWPYPDATKTFAVF